MIAPSTVVGFISALGWAYSSYLWVKSTRVKLTQSPSSVFIQGRPAFNPEDMQDYLRRTGQINANAGMVSAISAAASALSLFLQVFGH